MSAFLKIFTESASSFDWSQPVVKKEDELVLNWDDDADNDDESPPMSMKLDKKTDKNEAEKSTEKGQ